MSAALEYYWVERKLWSFYPQITGGLIRSDACLCHDWPDANAECPIDRHRILWLYQHWEW